MPPVYLKDSHGFIYYNNTVTLRSFKTYITTTKPAAAGRWYYEVTHIEGNNGGILGYRLNNEQNKGFFIAERSDKSFFIWFYDSIKIYSQSRNTNMQNHQNIDLIDVPDGFTIGLAFDSFSRIFSVFYEDQMFHFNISCQSKDLTVMPHFLETTGIEKQDTIYVNFGQDSFHYGVPFGYLPWQSTFYYGTCIAKHHFIISTLLFISIIL